MVVPLPRRLWGRARGSEADGCGTPLRLGLDGARHPCCAGSTERADGRGARQAVARPLGSAV